MTAKKLLGSSAWLIRNNQIANVFKSNDAAILIGYLCDRDSFFTLKSEEKGIPFDGWFFCEAATIEKGTVCTPHIQRKWFKIFEEVGILDIKLKGIPPKKHFKINEDALNLLMDSKCQPGEDLNVNRVKIQISTGLTYISNNRYSNNRYSNINNICNFSPKNKLNGHSSLKTKRTKRIAPKNKKLITPKLFDKFWSLYPKRKNASKAKAMTSWNKLCAKPVNVRPKWKTIKRALKSQKKSERWLNQPQYIPHPTTWLNQNRWLDEAESLSMVTSYNDQDKKEFTYHGDFKLTKKSTKM